MNTVHAFISLTLPLDNRTKPYCIYGCILSDRVRVVDSLLTGSSLYISASIIVLALRSECVQDGIAMVTEWETGIITGTG